LKKSLIFLFFLLIILKSYSQDSIKVRSKFFGLSGSLLNNITSIDYGDDHEKITSPGRKMSLGYSAGLSYMYAYKKLLFEIGLQYAQENDKYEHIPAIVPFGRVLPDSSFIIENILDYNQRGQLYLRRTLLSILLKFNYQPLITKRISLGFGAGFSPIVIATERYCDNQYKQYINPAYAENKNGFMFKGVGSINLIYFITRTISVKAAPFVSIALKQRKAMGYNIRPVTVGLELGLFFTLNN
jgi:hypothetical protein